MPDQFPQQTIQPTPTSSKTLWIVSGAIVLLAAILLLLVFRQGGYIQTRVLLGTQEVTQQDEATVNGDTVVDEYTLVEAYCSDVHTRCQVDCQQYSFDYQLETCRPDCEEVLPECLVSTTAEEAAQYFAPVEVDGIPRDESEPFIEEEQQDSSIYAPYL